MASDFEKLFSDAVSGLKEYYPILSDQTIMDDLRTVVAEHFTRTGNDQKDYESLRDRIEHAVNEDEDIVRDDLCDTARRIQSGGHAHPKGTSLKM